MKHRIALCILAAALIALVSGTTVTSQSRTRLVNAATDAPALDLHVDSAAAASVAGVAGGYASELAPAAAAAHHLTVTTAGLPVTSGVLDTLVTMRADSAYTLVLAGGETIEPIVLVNADSMAVPPDSVLLRFVYAAHGAGTIDIGASIGSAFSYTADGIAYRSASPYRMVPAGALTIVLKEAGGAAFDKALGYIDGGTAVTVLITGDYDPANLARIRIYGLVDSDTLAQVPMRPFSLVPLQLGAFRAVHAMAGSGPVAIFSDKDASDSVSLQYRYASAIRTDLLGSHIFSVANEADGLAGAFIDTAIVIPADTLVTMIVGGNGTPIVLNTSLGNLATPGHTMLRVVNTIAGGNPLDVEFVFSDATRLQLHGVQFKTLTDFGSVPSGQVQCNISGWPTGAISFGGSLPDNAVVTAIISAGAGSAPGYVSLLEESNSQEQEPMILLSPLLAVPAMAGVDGAAPASIAPNPASGPVRLAYTLPSGTDVSITLYDALGREASTLHVGRQDAGERNVVVPTGDLRPGAYTVVVRSAAGSRVAMGRLMVVR